MKIDDLILFTLSSGTLVALVFLVLRYLGLRHRQMVHLERLAAIDKGILPEGLGDDAGGVPSVSDAAHSSRMEWFRVATLGLGFLLLFGGMGMLTALLVVEDWELRKLWALGLIPISTGFGLMAFWLLAHKLAK